MTNKKITVNGIQIITFQKNVNDFISLTDIAKYKNADDPRFVIQNWMKTKSTLNFLGAWEQIYHPDFNRIEFDTVKNEAGINAFVLTPRIHTDAIKENLIPQVVSQKQTQFFCFTLKIRLIFSV